MSLTYLEFYSGIGGWSYALKEAIDSLNKLSGDKTDADNPAQHLVIKRLGAYDHSDLCNKVLHYNVPEIGGDDEQNNASSTAKERSRKKRMKSLSKTVSIESLTKKNLEDKSAIIWMMSPPCQPHTRQHVNQEEDIQDPRSKSFIHLCDMISTMEWRTLPNIILLENVVGFENSNSCRIWRKALRCRNYSVSHFHLNPTQCAIPNDRPRYYAIAVLLEDSASLPIIDEVHVLRKDIDNSLLNKWFANVMETDADKLDECAPIQTSIDPLNIRDDKGVKDVLQISQFLDSRSNEFSELYVPEKLLKSNSSWCFDIVTPSDKRSACFTSSYGRFIRGTGSVIIKNLNDSVLEKFKLVSPEERTFESDWTKELAYGDLRYFSGTELARLFGFPVDPATEGDGRESSTFRFPPDCSLKQQWKLMGNSLNVRVASKICETALRLILVRSKSSDN